MTPTSGRARVLDGSAGVNQECTTQWVFLEVEEKVRSESATLKPASLSPEVLAAVQRSGRAERLGCEPMSLNLERAVESYLRGSGSLACVESVAEAHAPVRQERSNS